LFEETRNQATMCVRIQRLTIRLCRNATREEEHYTTGAPPPAYRSLVVEAIAGGMSGFGECIPTSIVLAGWNEGKSGIDEWSAALRAGEVLLGCDGGASHDWVPDEWRDCSDYSSVIDAIDFALYDLAGRLTGKPLSALLGRTQRLRVPYVHTLFLGAPADTATRAHEVYRRTGTRFFKLKPSGTAEEDAATMILTRERVPGARFSIDPNCGLRGDAADVTAYLNRLQPLGLDICEDPVAADWDIYARIQKGTDVALMVDAGARTRRDVLTIISARCARWVNIHANWGGGFQQSLGRADVAQDAGLKVMVGAARFLGIGTAAYQLLAGLLPEGGPCEQEPARMTSRTAVVHNEFAIRDGLIWLEERPGLGIEVDRDALAAVTEKEEVLT